MKIALLVLGGIALGFVITLLWMWVDHGQPPWEIFGKSGNTGK